MIKAEETAKEPYLLTLKGRPSGALTPDEVAKMTYEVRLAGLRALFAHMVSQTVVAGTGGGPSPVVGNIL